MVEAVELARFLDGLDVGGVFDNADHALIPRGTPAEEARILIGDVVADRAFADFFLGVANCVGESEGLVAVRAKQIKGEALRGFLPDAGQMFQFVDQTRYGWGEIRHVVSLFVRRCLDENGTGKDCGSDVRKTMRLRRD